MISYRKINKYPKCSHQSSIDWDFLLDHLKRYISDRKLDLKPDYQRNYVWNLNQKISFVEEMIKGREGINIIKFAHEKYLFSSGKVGPFSILDGKQRLTSTIEFLAGKFSVFNGNFINDFQDKDIMLRRTGFIFQIIDFQNRKEVLNYYIQLNSGGTIHTEEELDKVKKMINIL